MVQKFKKIITGLKPMSVNQAWQGRRFKTKAYTDFKLELCHLLGRAKLPEQDNLEVSIKVGLEKSSYSRSDVDNFCKPILDSIVEAGIIKDDRYITKLTIEKYLSKKYQIEVCIT